MSGICTCSMHCPLSGYHERACCSRTTCDCSCHRKSETRGHLTSDDPRMVAWEAFVASPDYANAEQWASMRQAVRGALWTAFVAGWDAREMSSHSPIGEVSR